MKPIQFSINLQHYPLTCQCGSPARSEIVGDNHGGIEEFYVCINRDCMWFDKWIDEKRQIQERLAREGKSFGRRRRRVWKAEIAKIKQARKRHVEMARVNTL